MTRKDIELLQQRGVSVTEESLTRGEMELLLKLQAELGPNIGLAFDLIEPIAEVQTVGGISGVSMHQAVFHLSSALLSQRGLGWPELRASLTSGPQIDVDLVLAILLKEGLDAARQLNKQPAGELDGPFGPDGFRLDGVLATGFVGVQMSLLRFAWSKQPGGAKLSDVQEHDDFKHSILNDVDRQLVTIKKKFLRAGCKRVLRWSNKHLVFREPRKTAAKTLPPTKPATKRKRKETVKKAGSHKRRR
jgi:hypothetical protein